MKTLITSLIFLALGSGSPSPARGAPVQNVIKAVSVSDRGEGVELAIQGTGTPNYTVFKLQDPPRLVVDLASADVSRVAAPIEVGRGGVRTISTTQYQDARSAIGRIIVAIEPDARYEVEQRAESVLVRVDRGQAKASPRVETARASASAQRRAPSADVPAKSSDESVSARDASAGTASSRDEHLVSQRIDEIRVKRAASTLLGVRASQDRITLSTDGEIGKIGIIELRQPARLALDLYGVVKAPKSSSRVAGPFTQVRFGKDAGKIRVVLDAQDEMPRYEVKRVPGGLAVVVQSAPAVSQKPKPATASAPATGSKRSTVGSIQDLRFSQSGGIARIELTGRAGHAVSRPDSRTVMMTLEGVQLPKRFERSLDTSAFNGPVTMVSSFNQPSVNRALRPRIS
jgi:type IV pilus assembly protein PilQ